VCRHCERLEGAKQSRKVRSYLDRHDRCAVSR
jgi:hypothetical protein